MCHTTKNFASNIAMQFAFHVRTVSMSTSAVKVGLHKEPVIYNGYLMILTRPKLVFINFEYIMTMQ